MKVFVTVGTTVFDSMIKAADKCAGVLKDYQFTFQIANSKNYKPDNGLSFDFLDNIEDYYANSDVIITHAGAGTFYKLLEMHKKIIVVPNLERRDKHQADIARFAEENKYALVVWELDGLLAALRLVENFQPNVFKKEHFFKAEEIAAFILS